MNAQPDLFAALQASPASAAQTRKFTLFTPYFYMREWRKRAQIEKARCRRVRLLDKRHIDWPRNPNKCRPWERMAWRNDRPIDWKHRYRISLCYQFPHVSGEHRRHQERLRKLGKREALR